MLVWLIKLNLVFFFNPSDSFISMDTNDFPNHLNWKWSSCCVYPIVCYGEVVIKRVSGKKTMTQQWVHTSLTERDRDAEYIIRRVSTERRLAVFL